MSSNRFFDHIPHFGRRRSRPKDVYSLCLLVKEQLLPKLRAIAFDLRNGKELTVDISVQLEASSKHGTALQDWQEIKLGMRDAIDEVRSLATKWSTLMKEAMAILQLTGDAESTGISVLMRNLSISIKILQGCEGESEKIVKKLKEVHDGITNFRKQISEESSVAALRIQPMIHQAKELISRLLVVTSPSSSNLDNLIKNSSTPGLMEAMATLLPSKTTICVLELINTKSNVTVDAASSSDSSSPPKEISELQCILCFGKFLCEDLSKALESSNIDRKNQWSPQAQYATTELYSLLQESLDIFVEYIEEGEKRGDSETSFASVFSKKLFRALHGLKNIFFSKAFNHRSGLS
ncbi:hypothetical protein SCHPADRAFT_1002375 [Schizopora paradoxa]|uniref:Uncharacterized protein n=1 Tax=Schizopora paradoxa TaxID=27342 RepID=A0A0H2R3K4_9AGAM|nr:hypothetical protein SCHPADRAFT_1002375 [Schizopora paradoxa]